MNSGEPNVEEQDAGASNNREVVTSLEEYFRLEMNPRTLRDYFERRFPSLEPASDEADLDKAVRALQQSGRHTLGEVNTLVDEQIGLVLDVIEYLNGSAHLATSIVRMSLFAATPDPEQLTVYTTAGSSIGTLVEAIDWCRAHPAEIKDQ